MVLATQLYAAPQLYDISLVEVTGRPGHQAFFPIQGQPIQGSQAVARVRLIGSASGVELAILDGSGTTLTQVPMIAPAPTQTISGTYFADITVPAVPFSLGVVGTDGSGNPFVVPVAQPQAILPATVSVRLKPTVSEISAGVPAHFIAHVANFGAAGQFLLTPATTDAASISPGTFTLSLPPQGSADADFSVTFNSLPSGALRESISVQVQRIGQQDSNTASIELPPALTPAQIWNAWRPASSDDSGLVVYACSVGVDLNTILLNNDFAPTSTSLLKVPVDSSEKGNGSAGTLHRCGNSAILKLSFGGVALRSLQVRALNVGPSYVPLTAFSTSGIPLVAYLPSTSQAEVENEHSSQGGAAHAN